MGDEDAFNSEATTVIAMRTRGDMVIDAAAQ